MCEKENIRGCYWVKVSKWMFRDDLVGNIELILDAS